MRSATRRHTAPLQASLAALLLFTAPALSGCDLSGLAEDIKDKAQAFIAELQVNGDQVQKLVKLGSRAQQIIAARLQKAQANNNTTLAAAPLYSSEDTSGEPLDPNASCSQVGTGNPVLETFENCPNAEGQIKYELSHSGDTTKFDVTFTNYKEGTDSRETYLGLNGTNTWQVTFSNTTINIVTNEQLTIEFYPPDSSSDTPMEVASAGTITYTFDIFNEDLTIQGNSTYTQNGKTKTLSYANVVFDFSQADGCSRGPESGKVVFADPAAKTSFTLTIASCGEGTGVNSDGLSTAWDASMLEPFFADTLNVLQSIIQALNTMYRDQIYTNLKDSCDRNPDQPECQQFEDYCALPADADPTTWTPPQECGYYYGYAGMPQKYLDTWCEEPKLEGTSQICIQLHADGQIAEFSFKAATCRNPEQWGYYQFDPSNNNLLVSIGATNDTFVLEFIPGDTRTPDTLKRTKGTQVQILRRNPGPWSLQLCTTNGGGTTCTDYCSPGSACYNPTLCAPGQPPYINAYQSGGTADYPNFHVDASVNNAGATITSIDYDLYADGSWDGSLLVYSGGGSTYYTEHSGFYVPPGTSFNIRYRATDSLGLWSETVVYAENSVCIDDGYEYNDDASSSTHIANFGDTYSLFNTTESGLVLNNDDWYDVYLGSSSSGANNLSVYVNSAGNSVWVEIYQNGTWLASGWNNVSYWVGSYPYADYQIRVQYGSSCIGYDLNVNWNALP